MSGPDGQMVMTPGSSGKGEDWCFHILMSREDAELVIQAPIIRARLERLERAAGEAIAFLEWFRGRHTDVTVGPIAKPMSVLGILDALRAALAEAAGEPGLQAVDTSKWSPDCLDKGSIEPPRAREGER